MEIVVFTREDQAAVRALILDGLAERWGGQADPTLNLDLADIATSYATGTTLIARLDGRLAGTGTVVPREPGVEEVVRMSVAPEARGHGVATKILGALVEVAEARGARRIICETSAHWDSAIKLYLSFGFRFTHYRDGDFGRDAYFALDLR